MLRLVLFTIIMTTFLTGCGENNKYKAADGSKMALGGDGNKTTDSTPVTDHDNMLQPDADMLDTGNDTSGVTPRALGQMVAELEAAKEAKAAAEAEVRALEDEQAKILEEGQAGIDQALENGLEAGAEERDDLAARLAQASQEVADAEDRVQAAQTANEDIIAQYNLLKEELNNKSDRISTIEAELAGMKAEETQEDDISDELKALEDEKAALQAQVAELQLSVEESEAMQVEVNSDEENASTDTSEESQINADEVTGETSAPLVVIATEDSNTINRTQPTRVSENNGSSQTHGIDSVTQNKTNGDGVQNSEINNADLQSVVNDIMDKRAVKYDVGGYVAKTEEVVEGTQSTTEKQMDTMLNLAKIFTPSDEKKPITLVFSGLSGDTSVLDNFLNTTFSRVWNSEEKLVNTTFSLLVSECGDDSTLSDFSGWLLPSVNANDASLNTNCTYKALDKSAEGSINLVEIPSTQGDSFSIDSILETVNPEDVLFATTLEKEDIENYNANDPKFSKYTSLMNLTDRLRSKTTNADGEAVGTLNFNDGSCTLLIISSTLGEEDFANNVNLQNLSSERCQIAVQGK